MDPREKKTKRSAHFRNDPFQSLKGIETGPSTAPKEPPPCAAVPGEEDGEQLFHRAAQGVRRIGRSDDDGAGPPPGRTGADGVSAPASGDEEAQFRQAMDALGASSFGEQGGEQDDDEAQDRRSSSGRLRRLKRGTIRIAEVLDLHGCLRDEAVRRLGHFIGTAYAQGREAVLVITGKGLNSPDGPILQGAVREWFRTAGATMVAEFHPAPRDKGGSGAYVVFLRRRT